MPSLTEREAARRILSGGTASFTSACDLADTVDQATSTLPDSMTQWKADLLSSADFHCTFAALEGTMTELFAAQSELLARLEGKIANLEASIVADSCLDVRVAAEALLAEPNRATPTSAAVRPSHSLARSSSRSSRLVDELYSGSSEDEEKPTKTKPTKLHRAETLPVVPAYKTSLVTFLKEPGKPRGQKSSDFISKANATSLSTPVGFKKSGTTESAPRCEPGSEKEPLQCCNQLPAIPVGPVQRESAPGIPVREEPSVKTVRLVPLEEDLDRISLVQPVLEPAMEVAVEVAAVAVEEMPSVPPIQAEVVENGLPAIQEASSKANNPSNRNVEPEVDRLASAPEVDRLGSAPEVPPQGSRSMIFKLAQSLNPKRRVRRDVDSLLEEVGQQLLQDDTERMSHLQKKFDKKKSELSSSRMYESQGSALVKAQGERSQPSKEAGAPLHAVLPGMVEERVQGGARFQDGEAERISNPGPLSPAEREARQLQFHGMAVGIAQPRIHTGLTRRGSKCGGGSLPPRDMEQLRRSTEFAIIDENQGHLDAWTDLDTELTPLERFVERVSRLPLLVLGITDLFDSKPWILGLLFRIMMCFPALLLPPYFVTALTSNPTLNYRVELTFALSCAIGVISFRWYGLHTLIGPSPISLDTYAHNHDLQRTWHSKSAFKHFPLIALWLMELLILVSMYVPNSRLGMLGCHQDNDDRMSIPTTCIAILGSTIFTMLCYCIVHFSVPLGVMVDRFCVDFRAFCDVDKSVRDWNVLQAMMRKTANCLDTCLVCLQTSILVALLLTGAALIFDGALEAADCGKNFLILSIARVLIRSMMVGLCSMEAASVSQKCRRAPPLINSFMFQDRPVLDPERSYMVTYMLNSEAGFYIKGIRFTFLEVIKAAYLLGVVAFWIINQNRTLLA